MHRVCAPQASAGVKKKNRKTATHSVAAAAAPAPAPAVSASKSLLEAEPDKPRKARRRRRLVLLRHAEATPKEGEADDHSRPLTAKGQEDAESFAKSLARRTKWLPSVVLASDSRRTRETLDALTRGCPRLRQARVIYLHELYEESATGDKAVGAIFQALRSLATTSDASVLCIGHNPGLGDASSLLTGQPVELKTASAALLKSTARSWGAAIARDGQAAGGGGWLLKGTLAIKPRRAKTKAAVKAKATVIADAPVTASAVAAVGDAGEAEAAVPAPDVAPARSSLVKKSKRAVRVSSEVTAR